MAKSTNHLLLLLLLDGKSTVGRPSILGQLVLDVLGSRGGIAEALEGGRAEGRVAGAVAAQRALLGHHQPRAVGPLGRPIR